jgi:hypothetical protein
VPVDAGVYENVCGADEAANVRLVGLNVPPAEPSENVIVSVTIVLGVRAKAAALATYPVDGPDSVYPTADTTKVAGDPVTTPAWALVTVIVLFPADPGVYENVCVADEFVKVMLVGKNVPPPLPSLNVITSVTAADGTKA